MKILNKIRASKYGKLIVCLMSIGVGVVTIYGFYYQVKEQPDVSFQIISEVNVLDIYKPLEDLQILFQGNDIQKQNLNLRIYTVKIENTGRINILENHFAQSDNWGIRIDDAKIIETRFITSNSTYIEKNLSPRIQNDNLVQFNKIIFDQNNYFTVELLVLHAKKIPPNLYRNGKIAGVKTDTSAISTLKNEKSFWTSFFYGNWFVHLMRIIFYAIITFIITIIITFIIQKMQERKVKQVKLSQAPHIDQPKPTN